MDDKVPEAMNSIHGEAIDLGHRLITLAYGYYSHAAAIDLAFNKKVLTILASSGQSGFDSVGIVKKKNGESHQFSKSAWLNHDGFTEHIQKDLDRIWLTGALIFAGDSLRMYNYFDHAPCLELIRHLRNAAAHNNRFRIDNLKLLETFPAHTKCGPKGYPSNSDFEITPAVDGTALMWDFMEPGDILDAIISAGYYLHEAYST
jgi:hypothetical protein